MSEYLPTRGQWLSVIETLGRARDSAIIFGVSGDAADQKEAAHHLRIAVQRLGYELSEHATERATASARASLAKDDPDS